MFRNKRMFSRKFGPLVSLAKTPVTMVQAVAGTNSFGGLTVDKNFASNVTAGNTIILLVQWMMSSGTNSISSISDSLGNSYTINAASKSTTVPAHATEIGTQIVYATNIFGGNAGNITVTFNSSCQYSFVSIIEVTPSTFDQSAGATGSGFTPSAGSLTTSQNGSFAAAVMATDDGLGNSNVITAGSGYTLLQNTGGGSFEEGAEYRAQSNAGVIAGDFSVSLTGTWVASMATFKPS